MQPIRAVCFDLDETLVYMDWELHRARLAQVCAALATLHMGLDATALLDRYFELTLALWRQFETELALPQRLLPDGRSIGLQTWRRALDACGCVDESAHVSALDLYWRDRLGVVKLFQDTREALQRLRGRVRLAVITNGPADTQLDKLQVHGLDGYFDAFVASGEAGYAKPDGAIFELALERLGVSAAEVLHVGDSLSNDVAGARAAGLRSVWLNRRSAIREPHHAEPHYEIASLAQLEACLGLG